MQIKNASETISLLGTLQQIDYLRSCLSEPGATVTINAADGPHAVPPALVYNLLNVLNCEFERLRARAADIAAVEIKVTVKGKTPVK